MKYRHAALALALFVSPTLGFAHPTGDVKITEVGEVSIGSFKVSAKQVGSVEAKKTATFEIYLKGNEEPKVVRVWVGDKSGKGSVKAKAVKTAKYYDADVEIPESLTSDSALWVEIESGSGREKGMLPIHRH